jgi:predicted outer membrane repeat protein
MKPLIIITTVFILTIGSIVIVPYAREPITWYVDDDAPGDPGPGDPSVSDPLEDGTANHPFDAIQEGIDAAVSGDTVLVSDGTYAGIGNRNLDFSGKAITLQSENGPDNCVIDVERAGRGFYFHSGETGDAVLEGLKITRGDTGIDDGAGIYIDESSPTIRNCRIEDNRLWTFEFDESHGGGIYCSGNCSPAIIDCTISNNKVESGYLGDTKGGGIYSEASSITITNCTISDNISISESSYGGGAGIYLRLGNPTVSGCTISGNNSNRYGGGIYLSGCEAQIINCQILNNESRYPGGAVYSTSSGTQIFGCTISGNTAMDDATIELRYAGASEPELRGCIITDNHTEGKGGAVYCYRNAPIIRNCLIADNQADDSGGGIVIEESDPEIFNCTIAGNFSAVNGGGIYCVTDSFPAVTNCILYDNQAVSGPQIWIGETAPCTLAISHSNVMSGYTAAHVGSGHTLTWGTGMIDSAPGFVDPVNQDYHLSDDSVCIDSGDPGYLPEPGETDMDGDARVQQYAIDMGADETPWLRDCNENGISDVLDISLGASRDCNTNIIPDECDIAEGTSGDCNHNGIPDICDIASGASEDCNRNHIPDLCEVIALLGEAGDTAGIFGAHEASRRCLPCPKDLNGDCILDECETGTKAGLEPSAWYVDDDAPGDPGPGTTDVSDPNENGSEAHPFDAIQEAINAAIDGDEVIVLDGRYTGTGNKYLDLTGKLIAVRSANGPADCIIDMEGTGLAFTFHSGETEETLVEGFKIKNGQSTYGGAMNCNSGASPTLSGCIFQNNSADYGGALSCDSGGAPRLHNCTFGGNTAIEYDGGAIYCFDSSLHIEGCTIQNNVSEDPRGEGAGIFCDGMSTLTVIDSLINGNQAQGFTGGGIHCTNGSQLTMLDCVIYDNDIDGDGSGIGCLFNSRVVMTSCMVAANGRIEIYNDGGGIYVYQSDMEIRNSTIALNNGYSGGALYGRQSALLIQNCLIAGNLADRLGAALHLDRCNARVKNCTFSGNSASNYPGGGAIFCTDNTDLTVVNTILWGDSAPAGPELWIGGYGSDDPSTVSISYSDVAGGQDAVFMTVGDNTLTWGDGMIDEDPLFMDPSNNDYHLQSGSPCIDSGDPGYVPDPGETDIDGDPRVVNDLIDMGADEYVSP